MVVYGVQNTVLPNTKHVKHIQFSLSETDRSVTKTNHRNNQCALFGFVMTIHLRGQKLFDDYFFGKK